MKMLSYLRIRIFKKLIHPFSAKRRKERMTSFVAIMKPFEGMKIVDLGGTAEIWELVEIPLDITIVNLPGWNKDQEVESRHRIAFLEGDACDEQLLAGSHFQMTFSNSVIEHVGDREYQAAFAKVVHRLSEKYWVQTPSKLFPIEAHNGMPFWWYYPDWLKQYFLKGWSWERAYCQKKT